MSREQRERSAAAEKAAGVVLPGTEQRLMRASAGGREYRIMVFTPEADPPPAGYPAIYLLDANAVFGTMAEAVRLQSRRPEKTGVAPAVIVGIGYPTASPFAPERYYDFTLSASEAELPSRPGGQGWPEQGGADLFLKFIEEDLQPWVDREYGIDRGRRTIFGHSLGGLFVLHTLFSRPSLFRKYVAGSPSIHWNERLLLEEERQFVSRLNGPKGLQGPNGLSGLNGSQGPSGSKGANEGEINVDLLLAAGERERSHKSGMNDNARKLFARLSACSEHGVNVSFKEFEDEGHISVLPVLISRALRFALAPDEPGTKALLSGSEHRE